MSRLDTAGGACAAFQMFSGDCIQTATVARQNSVIGMKIFQNERIGNPMARWRVSRPREAAVNHGFWAENLWVAN